MVSIDVKEATIRTAAVEIKTLSVSGKQVTMGLFRQFQVRAIIEEATGELMGTAWGRVNYFWGACKDADHLHIVWQDGSELFRSCVYSSKWNNGEWEVEQVRKRLHVAGHARYAQLIIDGTTWGNRGADNLNIPMKDSSDNMALHHIPDCKCTPDDKWSDSLYALEKSTVWREPKYLAAHLFDLEKSRDEFHEETATRVAERTIELLKDVKEFPMEDALALEQRYQEYQDIIEWWETARKTYKESYSEIASLPQLFIAV